MPNGISKIAFIAGLVIAILASSALSTVVALTAIQRGPQGPAGPEGPQGMQGEQGPQGPRGSSQYPIGSIQIPLLTFIPPDGENYQIDLTYVGGQGGVNNPMWAPVQLPYEVYVTNLTALLYDASPIMHVVLELWRYNPTNDTSLEIMASVRTTNLDDSSEPFLKYDNSIDNAQIDNENFVYGLKLYNSVGGSSPNALGLQGVKIDYEYQG